MATTKEAIIAAARSVLVNEGSAAFSVRKVAKAAGISLGNLQYHYASRVDLLGGLLDADVAAYRMVYDQMQATSDERTQEGRDSLHRFVSVALSDAQHQEQSAIFRALYSFTDPEIIGRLNTYYSELYGLLVQGLAHVRGLPVEFRVVARAAAILFPYLDGFESSGGLLDVETDEIAELLTDIVWALLDEEVKQ